MAEYVCQAAHTKNRPQHSGPAANVFVFPSALPSKGCINRPLEQEEPLMRWFFSGLTVVVVCAAAGSLFAAQELPAKNPLEGNADAIRGGMGLYRARCADCHGMDARGVRAPDITQVWASGRTDAGLFKTIKEGVRGAEDFGQGYEPVTLTPSSGAPIQGVKKNEDLFSVQIMDTRERIQGYEKDKMKSVKNDTQSAMPIFGPDRLSDNDLDDLLRYL